MNVSLQKAQEEIEERLKTAEMLALKGDTRGQKEQIVNELIRVHQRFQARMNEYQVLIKMTIEFFKNVSQVGSQLMAVDCDFFLRVMFVGEVFQAQKPVNGCQRWLWNSSRTLSLYVMMPEAIVMMVVLNVSLYPRF